MQQSQGLTGVASRALEKSSPMRDLKGRAGPTSTAGIRLREWQAFCDRKAVSRWDKLAHSASEPNPFYESWFLLPSLEAFDPVERIQLLTMERGGDLLGLMPLKREWDYYGKPIPHMTNWQHANCFLGTPLVAQGAERLFWRELLGWADENPRSAVFLHLSDIGRDGPVGGALNSVLSDNGRAWGLVREEERAVLRHGPTADEYRAEHLSKQKRKDLRRRLKRLGECGEVRFEWSRDNENIDEWIERFLELEASGWKGERGSALAQHEATSSIFRSALSKAARRERLLRLSLHLDERPIAMLSTFLSAPGAFGFKTAFDEEYSRYAPGILIENEFLNSLDHGSYQWCDSCAAPGHPVMSKMWSGRRKLGKISIAIGGSARRALFNQFLRFEMSRQSAGADK